MKKHELIELEMTCGACPEQYDAIYEGEIVGHLRLRHGYFRVECNNKTVYEAHPKGDGIFDSEERNRYLKKAKKAIYKEISKHMQWEMTKERVIMCKYTPNN